MTWRTIGKEGIIMYFISVSIVSMIVGFDSTVRGYTYFENPSYLQLDFCVR